MKQKLAPSRLKKPSLKERMQAPLLLILTIILGWLLIQLGRKWDTIEAYEGIQINYQEPIVIEKEVIREIRIAKVTAYSCGGLQTDAEVDMNCPSLRKHPQGRTYSGTTPRPNVTVACDKSNLGRTFEIKGIGQVKCEDTGSAIQGAGRFDLYVENVDQAYAYGVKYLEYWEVK